MNATARQALRAVLLALLFAFVVGFGIGTWLRCRMEKPATFIGATPRIERAG